MIKNRNYAPPTVKFFSLGINPSSCLCASTESSIDKLEIDNESFEWI